MNVFDSRFVSLAQLTAFVEQHHVNDITSLGPGVIGSCLCADVAHWGVLMVNTFLYLISFRCLWNRYFHSMFNTIFTIIRSSFSLCFVCNLFLCVRSSFSLCFVCNLFLCVRSSFSLFKIRKSLEKFGKPNAKEFLL